MAHRTAKSQGGPERQTFPPQQSAPSDKADRPGGLRRVSRRSAHQRASGNVHPPLVSPQRKPAPKPPALIPGGKITLSEKIPLQILKCRFTKAHGIIAEALDDPKLWKTKTTINELPKTIEKAFVETVSAPMRNLDLPFHLSLEICTEIEGDEPIIMLCCDGNTVITPIWFDDPSIDDAIKKTVYHTMGEALSLVIPCGNRNDLFEHAARFYWDGEETDDAAIEAFRQYNDDEDAEPDILPSRFNSEMPAWTEAETPEEKKAGTAHLPQPLRDKIDRLRAATERFENHRKDNAFWKDPYDTIENLGHADESGDMAPVWFVPYRAPFIDILNDMGEYAMQTGFYRYCAATPIKSVDDVRAAIEGLKEAAILIRAIIPLLDEQTEKEK